MQLRAQKLLYFVLLLVIPITTCFGQATPASTEALPWDLERLNQAPAFEWVDKEGPVRSLFYVGEPYGGKPTRVFAYYATPATLAGKPTENAKYPAVVLVHGGGGTAFREWAELWAKRGYAAIAMDLAGHRPIEGKNAHAIDSRTRLPDGGPNQGDEEKFGSVDKPATEQWPYHAVAAVLRAHSLIRTFPEVDADHTAVTGISWGGYLTCIVAGVDSRFKAAVPVYGCGYLAENSAWLARFDQFSPEQRKRWTALWDPSHYLKMVKMPIFFVNGTNDFAYPLDSYMKSYDTVPGAKSIRVTVNMPHGHPPGWEPLEIGLFIDQHLRKGDPLPEIQMPVNFGDVLDAKVKNVGRLVEATLHFTTEGGAINGRAWQSRPAKLEDKSIVVEVPPANASAWFLTLKDYRGAIVSSPVKVISLPANRFSTALSSKLQAGVPVRIVCFGDSVTGLYYHTGGHHAYTDMVGVALKKVFRGPNVQMINAGISGNTTVDALARIDRDVLAHKPTLVTVMFGLNDMTRVPVEDYVANLRLIIDKCKGAGAEVLLCTPNNVITTPGRPTEKLEQYCEWVRAVGSAQNVPVCDCYQGLQTVRNQDPAAWRLLLSDEIHPNMAGHKRIAEMIAHAISDQKVSLDDVAPYEYPVAATLARSSKNDPVKVLVMPPFDTLIGAALKKVIAKANPEVVSWPTEGKSLSQLEEEAKARVREMKPSLVLIAIPRSATAESAEAFIKSYTWVMNWSLSFGAAQWDCVVVHPSVFDPKNADAKQDELIRRLVRAQDLTLIDRAANDTSSAEEILQKWLQKEAVNTPGVF